MVGSVGHVYLISTAVCCLVAMCLVAIRDLASRESQRILGHLAWRLKERVIKPALKVNTEDDESSILLISRFRL